MQRLTDERRLLKNLRSQFAFDALDFGFHPRLISQYEKWPPCRSPNMLLMQLGIWTLSIDNRQSYRCSVHSGELQSKPIHIGMARMGHERRTSYSQASRLLVRFLINLEHTHMEIVMSINRSARMHRDDIAPWLNPTCIQFDPGQLEWRIRNL